MKVLLFAKQGKPYVKETVSYIRKRTSRPGVYLGKPGSAFPNLALKEPAELLISYISPWIIPESVLSRTKLWNINFHPGPPEYPGIGCFNFALYNEEKEYGVTAHIMEKRVDRGKIIGVKRFKVPSGASVFDLSVITYKALFLLFKDVFGYLLLHERLPDCSEQWKRAPYKRSELEALCCLDSGMSRTEIVKRIRATRYPHMPGAYLTLHGLKFEYNPLR